MKMGRIMVVIKYGYNNPEKPANLRHLIPLSGTDKYHSIRSFNWISWLRIISKLYIKVKNLKVDIDEDGEIKRDWAQLKNVEWKYKK